jgi:elongation factor P
MVRAIIAPLYGRRRQSEDYFVKVIASQVRKGNILEVDGKLYAVLTAESFHPGKGTPTTQIDMRGLADGVKTSNRYKTTEQVERAFVEDRDFSFLFKDGEGFTFMSVENYEQIIVTPAVVGDAAPYLLEGMVVRLSIFEDQAVGIVLPQRMTLEVVDTEPTTKGQTASSSYKPAILSNGVRSMVPPHIGPGTRIVVLTEDGSYVERAKD